MDKTTMQDGNIYFGEGEFTNLVKVLIRAYQYRNNNQKPKFVVFPEVKEVDGVKVEWPIN